MSDAQKNGRATPRQIRSLKREHRSLLRVLEGLHDEEKWATDFFVGADVAERKQRAIHRRQAESRARLEEVEAALERAGVEV